MPHLRRSGYLPAHVLFFLRVFLWRWRPGSRRVPVLCVLLQRLFLSLLAHTAVSCENIYGIKDKKGGRNEYLVACAFYCRLGRITGLYLA